MTIATQLVELTSDAGGDASTTVKVNGLLAGVETINDGTDTPTDQWDLTIATEQGTTIFTDTGIGNAANEFLLASLDTYHKFPVSGTLTITGANMGATKKAKVVLYIEY